MFKYQKEAKETLVRFLNRLKKDQFIKSFYIERKAFRGEHGNWLPAVLTLELPCGELLRILAWGDYDLAIAYGIFRHIISTYGRQVYTAYRSEKKMDTHFRFSEGTLYPEAMGLYNYCYRDRENQ